MINYIEKGKWLHDAITEAGYTLTQKGLTWESSNDVEVQAIIDTFDPLPFAREEAKKRVKQVGATKIANIYPFINADSAEAVGLYDFAYDLYMSTVPSGREPLSGNLLALKGVYDAAVAAISVINGMTDWEAVRDYDAINTPDWP